MQDYEALRELRWCGAELHRVAGAQLVSQSTALERTSTLVRSLLEKKDFMEENWKEVLHLQSQWFCCLQTLVQRSVQAEKPTSKPSCAVVGALEASLQRIAPVVVRLGTEQDIALVFSIAGGLCALELLSWSQCWHVLVRQLLDSSVDDAARWQTVLVQGCAAAFCDLRLHTLHAVAHLLRESSSVYSTPAPGAALDLAARAENAWRFVLKPIGRLLTKDVAKQHQQLLSEVLRRVTTPSQRGDRQQRLLKASRKAFTDAMLALLSTGEHGIDLSAPVLLDVFGELVDNLLPNHCIAEPLRLGDFLAETFREAIAGRSVYGIAALEPLLFLMRHDGLEYEHIYEQVYSKLDVHTLLRLNACESATRGRVLRAVTQLLTSSHLPHALISAYTKRLARIALQSWDATLTLWALRLTLELVHRHTSARLLLESWFKRQQPDREPVIESSCSDSTPRRRDQSEASFEASGTGVVRSTPTKRLAYGFVFWERSSGQRAGDECASSTPGLTNDPFLADEPDPRRSNASASFLWEVGVLSEHFVSSVRQLAALFEDPEKAISRAGPLDAWCDASLRDLIELELRRSQHLVRNKPIAFEAPRDDDIVGDSGSKVEAQFTAHAANAKVIFGEYS